MILHLIGDPDFDFLIIAQLEECCPEENLFLLFSYKRSLNSFDLKIRKRILFMVDYPPINYSKIDGVLIHYLCDSKARFLMGIPKSIPVGLSMWGGDFYNFLPELKHKLYGGVTKKYLKDSAKNVWFYYILKDRLFFPVSSSYRVWEKAIRKVRIFSTVIPYERKLIEKYFKSDTKYLSLPTYSIDKVMDTDNYENTILTKENFQKNILIGNSGHPSNNHLEILNFLKKHKGQNFKFFLPLTYGNSNYIKYITRIGNSLFKSEFNALLDHLVISDFLNFINEFNVCIFNTYRQQGIGTILISIWSGGKVFLSNRNVTKSYFEDNGLKIFSIEDDLFNSVNTTFLIPLSRAEILMNREGLLELYSREKVNISVKLFLENLRAINIIS